MNIRNILGEEQKKSLSDGFANGLHKSINAGGSALNHLSETFGKSVGYFLHDSRFTQTIAILDKAF